MNNNELFAIVFVLLLFCGMLACFELGRRLGQRTAHEEASKAGLGTVEGAIFALLGLLIAFTFFRSYVESRLAIYQQVRDRELVRSRHARSQELQAEIWSKSVAAAGQSNNTAATMLLLPALNSMFDITTVRTAATEDHPPKIIFVMLGLIALASSMMAGFEMAGAKRRSWLHVVGYAVILSMAVYVILDLEYPRLGLIRVDASDHFLVDVRNSMK